MIANGGLLAYCQLAQRLGLSRRRALEIFRAAGGQVRTSQFLEVWRSAAAAEGAWPQSGLHRGAA